MFPETQALTISPNSRNPSNGLDAFVDHTMSAGGDFAGGPAAGNASTGENQRRMRWEPTPLPGGSRLYALAVGWATSKIKYRGAPERQMSYIANYVDTVLPGLELIGFDEVCGFGDLAEMSPVARRNLGFGILLLGVVLASDTRKGPSIGDVFSTFIAGGGDTNALRYAAGFKDAPQEQQEDKRPKPQPTGYRASETSEEPEDQGAVPDEETLARAMAMGVEDVWPREPEE